MMSSFKIIIGFSLISSMSMAAADPFAKQQWGIKNTGNPQSIELDHITAFKVQGRIGQDIQIPAGLTKAAKKILVAVLDTGIDHSHPDLKSQIHRNESECRALEKFLACSAEKSRAECEKIWMDLNNPEVDQDKNGYPLDCHGWSIIGSANAAGILGKPDFTDEQGHGTHVAGIIAAASGNGIGITGASSNVEILPVQVLSVKPSEPLKPLSLDISPGEKGKEAYRKSLGDLVARGVIYAIRSGAQVINFSMGWPESNDSAYLRQVIHEAQARGIIIVAAAGNDSTRALLRPCAYPGVICVAANGPDGSLSHFSNYGTGVDISAPGTNILSTYPLDKRPVRFRSVTGYEFLHGTSQASPYVAAMVAELLAQGIPANEVYPRLILGSRSLQAKLPLLEGAAHDLTVDRQGEDSRVEKKWILSGQVDLAQALKVSSRALILPSSKEKKEILWDRKAKVLTANFKFKNLWKDADFSQIALKAQFLRPSSSAIRPTIVKADFINKQSPWKQGEERELSLQFSIDDTAIPAQTRIPSDLDLALELKVGQDTFRLVLENEIIVPITAETVDSEMETLELKNMPQMRTSLVAIDENLDQVLRTDYLAIAEEKGAKLYHLLKQDNQNNYQTQGLFQIKLGEDLEKATEVITARTKWNSLSADAGYVMGLLIDRSETEDPNVFSSLQLHYLDSQFKLQKKIEITNKNVQLPTAAVGWMQMNGLKIPAWVGLGKDPNKRPSVRDDWENSMGAERAEIRFYFMDGNGKLGAIARHEGFQFIDTLTPSAKQLQAGRVSVLMAKNRGTPVKPSYIYDFAVAEVFEGKVEGFRIIDLSLEDSIYRNLLDTRVDKVLSLDSKNPQALGTFWFGEGTDRGQRLSMLVNSGTGHKFYDANLSALRGKTDSALWVRSAFVGSDLVGAFAFTNSEMQFHDLSRQQIAVRSFERYTFYQSMAYTNLHFPLTVRDQRQPNQMLPALFTTEASGLSKGISVKTASRDQAGNLIEILVPAKLRYKSAQGCRPLDNPTVASDGTPSMDYYCGTKILRMKLSY